MGRFLIYALSDPRTDEVRYVGKSCSGLYRPTKHWQPKALATDQTYKANWLRGLVADGFKPGVHVLYEASSRDVLPEAERWWIAYGRAMCWPLTNLTIGGDGVVGSDLSVREKLRRAHTGRKQSEETKAKRLASVRAYWAEHGHPLVGRKASEATRAKMAAARTGRRHSPEAIAKMAAAKVGIPRPDHVRHAIAAARRGKPLSESHRAALRAAWARRKARGNG